MNPVGNITLYSAFLSANNLEKELFKCSNVMVKLNCQNKSCYNFQLTMIISVCQVSHITCLVARIIPSHNVKLSLCSYQLPCNYVYYLCKNSKINILGTPEMINTN